MGYASYELNMNTNIGMNAEILRSKLINRSYRSEGNSRLHGLQAVSCDARHEVDGEVR